MNIHKHAWLTPLRRAEMSITAESFHENHSLRALAKHYGIDQKTIAKWKKRTSVADLPTDPKEARSTVLSVEEAVVVAFRRYTLAPLDRCLYALQPTFPHLTRSGSLPATPWHRTLPHVGDDRSAKKKFKNCLIGYFQIDIA